MLEKFKNIFEGLERAHGVTKIGQSNGNGTKVKGQSFVKREPVTNELWQKHLDGKENRRLLIWSLLCFEEWIDVFLN